MPKSSPEKSSTLRVPPHSIEAEQAVLGALMLDPSTVDDVADLLSPGDFYRRDHQFLFHAMLDLNAKGAPIDAVSMGDWLQSVDAEALTGGLPYLVQLAQTTPSASSARFYAGIVRSKAMLRQVIERATEAAELAFAPLDLTDEQVVSKAEELILSVGERARTGGEDVQSLMPSLKAAIEDLQYRYENPGSLRGVPTGLRDLDAKTLGLRDGALIVVAGRPGMGKSTLGQGFVEAVLEQTKKSVLVFSLEMSSEDWTGRLLCSRARIDATRFQTGQLEDEDWAKVTAATAELSGWRDRLFFSYQSSNSPEVVRSRARRLTRKQDVGLIVIDYLQLMAAPGYASENRATEVAAISRQLKGMAQELKVPVVALSQLNRGVESRMDKRPNLSDLRESGAIEQDADIVMLLYRDEYYNRDSEARGVAEIILAKQRNGEAGTVEVRFHGSQCRFTDL